MDPVVAGQAPPPPPTTWEAPYGGAQGESTGIIAMLDIIKEDIEKDRKNAKKEELDARKEFYAFKKEAIAQKKELIDEAKAIRSRMGEKKKTLQEVKKSRTLKKKKLDAVMTRMTDALPLCDFTTINFETRKKNRQIEMEGLIKATGILKGATS